MSNPGPFTYAATSGHPELPRLEQAVVDSAERTGVSDERLKAVIRIRLWRKCVLDDGCHAGKGRRESM